MSWKPQLSLWAECDRGRARGRGRFCHVSSDMAQKAVGSRAELPSKPWLHRPGTGRHGSACCTCQGSEGYMIQCQARSPWHDNAANAKGISFNAILGFQEEGVFQVGA